MCEGKYIPVSIWSPLAEWYSEAVEGSVGPSLQGIEMYAVFM